MALRLIEIVLKEKEAVEIRELLKDSKLLEHRQVQLMSGEVLARILLDEEQSGAVLDALEKRFASSMDNRVVVLPVKATLPRAPRGRPLERIDREELYEGIKDAALCSRGYIVMELLSTILAAVGLLKNSVAVIIGAMVIAPMLGPSMALALGTTLGDLPLLRRAFLTGLAGIITVSALSLAIGALVYVDPTLPELAMRTRVGLDNIAVALAAGAAGALAFTTGVAATLIGVMVAVALLPPLVAFGLLLGNGNVALSMGALSLFSINLICVNLASVITFLAQGTHPAAWRERAHTAAKNTRIAIALWILLLAILIGLILLLRTVWQ